VQAGLGNITPQQMGEVAKQFPEEPEPPPNITSRDQAFDALQRGLAGLPGGIDQQQYMTYDQYYTAQEEREAAADKAKSDQEAGLKLGKLLDEAQQKIERDISALKDKKYIELTTEEYKNLDDDDEQKKFNGPSSDGVYWRKDPEVIKKIEEGEARLQDFAAQRQVMDSIQTAITAAPTPEGAEQSEEEVAKQSAANEMRAARIEITDADLADPDFMTVYQAWKAAQSANVQ
jgi:hypothetical protein